MEEMGKPHDPYALLSQAMEVVVKREKVLREGLDSIVRNGYKSDAMSASSTLAKADAIGKEGEK